MGSGAEVDDVKWETEGWMTQWGDRSRGCGKKLRVDSIEEIRGGGIRNRNDKVGWCKGETDKRMMERTNKGMDDVEGRETVR